MFGKIGLASLVLWSSAAFSAEIGVQQESGYQSIGRIQQWTGERFNVFLTGANNNCGSTIYTILEADLAKTGAKNAVSMILAAKMANKKVGLTYVCTTDGQWGKIVGVNVE